MQFRRGELRTSHAQRGCLTRGDRSRSGAQSLYLIHARQYWEQF
jgi:hypothetical protein